MVPEGELECPRCGAPLEESTPASDSQEDTLEEFIESSHEKLVKAGTSAAELAFGVGCTLEVIVAGLLMVIIFLAFTKTWTILAVILFILTLISILISSILANRARDATTRATYQREVKPDIDHFLTTHGLSEDEFNDQIKKILPENSPILLYSSGQNNQD
jgi:ABC-type multidrug transport system fused ATPase/permease subunit